jgi:hypothetical protein
MCDENTILTPISIEFDMRFDMRNDSALTAV